MWFLYYSNVCPPSPCCSVGHFSDMYAKKLGINAEVLRKTLWGNYFLNTKTKRVCKKAQVHHV